MVELTPAQIEDLRELQVFCARLQADLVVIGAVAYQHYFPETDRHTGDIDSAIALDLEEFAELERFLVSANWTRRPALEHRWRSSRGNLLDLLPAGKGLREAKQVTWPNSQFTMSLIGFDHVFANAEQVMLADQLRIKIIPPIVLMLLKIVAFMDDQNRRAKDLSDIRLLLKSYESSSDRLFSDAVLDAGLQDFDLANAFRTDDPAAEDHCNGWNCLLTCTSHSEGVLGNIQSSWLGAFGGRIKTAPKIPGVLTHVPLPDKPLICLFEYW